jgi:predicted transcriptional regulator
MMTPNHQQPTPGQGPNKDTQSASQLKKVRDHLKANTASRFMVAVDTGIPIQNVCRYVKTLADHNNVAIAKMGKCRITGEWVEFLTTDQTKFPKPTQTALF